MLEHLYGQITGRRRRWFERHPEARRRLGQPVISVGNLSVGGTGKTPLVARIAEWLIARGERPAILSRGYARRRALDGVTVVADGTDIAAHLDSAGDEPLMLARRVPGAIVCVSDDRHTAGALAERVLGATVHILDDGFQHVQLARDLDVLVTTRGEIPNGRVLPRGRLREAPSAAARAGLVVVVGADRDAARAEAWELGISAFSAAARVPDPSVIRGLAEQAPVVGVAGIGNPGQFFAMLRQEGVAVADSIGFADHRRYTAADLARISALLDRAGTRVVATTEKDAVRLAALQPLPFQCVPVPIRLELDDWDTLAGALDHALVQARNAA